MTQIFEQPETAEKPDTSAKGERWNEDLHRTDRGEARDILENAAIILRKDARFRGRLRWNEMLEAVEVRDVPWYRHSTWRPWTDADDLNLASFCQRKHAYLKPRTCASAVQLVARDQAVNPLRLRLSALEWDGQERLSGWLATYLGAKVEPGRERYLEAVARAWMISAVARAFKPGCKVDHALILEGMQGVKKSTIAATLAIEPQWFADEIADLGTKDSAQDLRGKWIVELAELSAMKRGEVERVKAFMSRSIDHYRPSYGTRSQDFPRRCVFIGSTNEDAYLHDATGNRRFWPVKVGRIEVEALERNRDQLWAEAVAAFRSGEPWWLDPEVETEAREEQRGRLSRDVWGDAIIPFLVGRDRVTVLEVLRDGIGLELSRCDQAAQNRVVRTLRDNGWERVQRRVNGKATWLYVPGPTGDSQSGDSGQNRTGDSQSGQNGHNGYNFHHQTGDSGPQSGDTGDRVVTEKPSNSADVTTVTTVTSSSRIHMRAHARPVLSDHQCDTGDSGDTPPEKSPHAHWLSMFQGADTDAKKRTIVETWVRKHGGWVDGLYLSVPAKLTGPERTALLRLAQEAGLRVPS